MYLLKITTGMTILIDGKPLRLAESGSDNEGAFVGTFVSEDESVKIEIATPKGAVIALDDTIKNFLYLMTRRLL